MKLALSISILLMLCRSSSAQTFQWAKGFGSNLLDNVLAIAVDHNGNVYTTGGFQSTCDFDPGLGIHNLTSIGNNDIYITKLDSNGNFIWALQLGVQTLTWVRLYQLIHMEILLLAATLKA
ncbi:MAG: hypothetical protein IPK62_10865 [Bacteroidetes bacterium]|nr:hypothetical protein [Bacteroidota bacterium]